MGPRIREADMLVRWSCLTLVVAVCLTLRMIWLLELRTKGESPLASIDQFTILVNAIVVCLSYFVIMKAKTTNCQVDMLSELAFYFYTLDNWFHFPQVVEFQRTTVENKDASDTVELLEQLNVAND